MDPRISKRLIFFICSCLVLCVFYSPKLGAQIQDQPLEVPLFEMALRDIRDIPVDNIRNFTLTQPRVVEVQSLPGNILRLRAVGQGSTILHVWDDKGRRSYQIVVSALGFATGLSGYRPSFNPGGAQFSYLLRTINNFNSFTGWQDPRWEHEFNSAVPFRNGRNQWMTTLRAYTDSNTLNGSAAPYSAATDLTYMLSYYRNPRFTIAAGDIFYTAGLLGIRGVAIRGGLFEFRHDNDLYQFFGGWTRPNFGEERFWEIDPQQLYGGAAKKEVAANIFVEGSFAFLNQAGAPPNPFTGETFQNDFVATLGLEAVPFDEKVLFEAEYGRSRFDNAWRGLMEYRPYWGRVYAAYRRIGTNYVTLSQGFLQRDFQEAQFISDFQPIRKLGFSVNYQFTNFGLSPDSLILESKTHSFFITSRYDPTPNTDLIATFNLSRASGEVGPQGVEQGTFTYQRYSTDQRKFLFVEAQVRHRDFQSADGSSATEETNGSIDVRYRHKFSKNLQLLLQEDFEVNNGNRSIGLTPEINFTQYRIFYGPSVTYTRRKFAVGGGVYMTHQLGNLDDQHFIQPFMTATYSPSQAIALATRSNLTHNFTFGFTNLSIVAEVLYRFGPGVPDTLISTITQSAKISGVIFLDRNADGRLSEGEELLEGFKVQLDGEPAKKAREGKFKFGVDPGHHQITLIIPETYESYRLNEANPLELSLRSREDRRILFGLNRGTLLLGRVAVDLNQNQAYDEGEPGVAGLRVRLTGPDLDTTLTVPGSGALRIPVPQPGSYRLSMVEASLPVGYQIAGATEVSTSVEVGQVGKFPPLFLLAKRYVAGRAFLDVDKNRVFSSGDTPVAGVQIHLGPYQTRTASDGTYLIKGIQAGTYPWQITPLTYQGHRLQLPPPITFGTEGGGREVPLIYRK